MTATVAAPKSMLRLLLPLLMLVWMLLSWMLFFLLLLLPLLLLHCANFKRKLSVTSSRGCEQREKTTKKLAIQRAYQCLDGHSHTFAKSAAPTLHLQLEPTNINNSNNIPSVHHFSILLHNRRTHW